MRLFSNSKFEGEGLTRTIAYFIYHFYYLLLLLLLIILFLTRLTDSQKLHTIDQRPLVKRHSESIKSEVSIIL